MPSSRLGAARFAVPRAPLGRMRLLFLVFALVSVVAVVVAIATTDRPPAVRLAAAAVGLWLAGHWALGYRSGRFAGSAEPLEAAALLLLLVLAPGDPFLPLFGLLFRSLYGGPSLAILRGLVWICVLLSAHAGRGDAHLEADIGRALGLALAPGVMQALCAALNSSEASQRRLRSLVQNSADVMMVVGDDLRIRWQADSIQSVLGHRAADVLDTPVLEHVHADDRAALSGYFAEARGRPDHSQTLTLRLRDGSGEFRDVEVVAANRLHDAHVGGFVLNVRDATERLRMARALHVLAAQQEHDALHDALTGLPNRRMLFDRLESAVTEARTRGEEMALLLVDLDNFKELNDTLGHHAGDQLLRDLRPRLTEATRNSDLVARLGGDEFAVLISPGVPAAEVEKLAERLLAAIEQPFSFQGLTLPVQASIGIAMYPRHAGDVETLVQRADIAMYSAKDSGSRIETYRADRDEHSKERLALIGELPHAIATGQMVVYYQPKVDLRTNEINSVEALVRWAHPERGLLGPGAFLPLAEHIGVMRPLTLHVLDRALADCAGWRAAGIDLEVAVNLAAPNLLDLAMPSDIAAALLKWDVDPSCLRLEITETLIAADPVRIGEVMSRLRAQGLSLALDDFGTGSSSLSYLRRLPVQELKIDKSFITDSTEDLRAAIILRSTIEMARTLGLQTVGEGIETEEELARLIAYGCDQGQGYLLGRPMQAEDLIRHVRAQVPSGLGNLPAAA